MKWCRKSSQKLNPKKMGKKLVSPLLSRITWKHIECRKRAIVITMFFSWNSIINQRSTPPPTHFHAQLNLWQKHRRSSSAFCAQKTSKPYFIHRTFASTKIRLSTKFTAKYPPNTNSTVNMWYQTIINNFSSFKRQLLCTIV